MNQGNNEVSWAVKDQSKSTFGCENQLTSISEVIFWLVYAAAEGKPIRW